jgi:transposase
LQSVSHSNLRRAIKILAYDGRGFWLCHRRLSQGRLRWWPESAGGRATALESHELVVLLSGGDPSATMVGPVWRRVDLPA